MLTTTRPGFLAALSRLNPLASRNSRAGRTPHRDAGPSAMVGLPASSASSMTPTASITPPPVLIQAAPSSPAAESSRGPAGVKLGRHGLNGLELVDLYKKQIEADAPAAGVQVNDLLKFEPYRSKRLENVTVASIEAMAESLPIVAAEIKRRRAAASAPIAAPAAHIPAPAQAATPAPQSPACDEDGVPIPSEKKGLGDLLNEILDLIQEIKKGLPEGDVPEDEGDSESEARALLKAGNP